MLDLLAGMWPLDDIGGRSTSEIVGGSVFSIGGVAGHFGGAGRLPVFVGVNECLPKVVLARSSAAPPKLVSVGAAGLPSEGAG